MDEEGVAFRLEFGVEEVHGWTAHESGDEHIVRAVVEGLGRIDLLQNALVHDCDATTHGHRFDLIVGDVDKGRPQLVVQLRQFRPRLHPQLGIQV